MGDKADVRQGMLALMVLKTLEALGPLHGYKLARRIEQISNHQLSMNQGTLYPALLKLEQMEWIAAKWGESESGRRVKIYSLTRAVTSKHISLTRMITGRAATRTVSARIVPPVERGSSASGLYSCRLLT